MTSNLLLLTIALLFGNPMFVTSASSSSTTTTTSSCPSIITSYNDCSSTVFSGKGSVETSCTEDTMTVGGYVSANAAFDVNATVTAVPCIAGAVCLYQYAQNLGSLCDLTTNDAGNDCGTAGTYSFSEETTYDIPKSYMRSMYGTVTIKLYLDDQGDECEEGQTMMQKLGFAAVPFVGVGLYSFLRQRQRRRPLLVLEGGTESFVEMSDMQSTGAMV